MTQHTGPHTYIPGGRALTNTSVDDLAGLSLRSAYVLPSLEGPNEDRFRRLLEALAQRRADPLP